LTCAAAPSSTASTPASTRAVCVASSISIPRMRSVLITIVCSSAPIATAPWPVPRPVTFSPFREAKSITLATSSALSTKATAAGRRSAARFHAARA
jgi:hypothetical protein